MNFYIVIPAHNEEDYIGITLKSLIEQTLLPKKIVIVNDNSTDKTAEVIAEFTSQFSWITSVDMSSSSDHLPGSKVINAFYKGLQILDDNYDIICKFDADLIFPNNYLEKLASHFKGNPNLGIASGFCYILKNETWVLEDLTQKDHIRGALKAYRKACFFEIGKLKRSMGWDTVDELLAKYYKWDILTDNTLVVKHLRPTGQTYHSKSKLLQGEAFYKMRYGLLLTIIAGLKGAFKLKRPSHALDVLKGYFKATTDKIEFLVTKDQGRFIRQYRWKNIIKKCF